MPFRRRSDLANAATTILATSFVVVAGAAVCTFIIAAFADDPKKPVLVSGAVILGMFALAWLLRSKKKGAGESKLERDIFWILRREIRDEAQPYQPQLKRPRNRTQSFGSNAPPSAESVRQIRDESTTWVPTDRHVKPDKRNRD